MNREVLLKEMKDAVGTKDPIEFFAKMVDTFALLFDRIDFLEKSLRQIKTQSALAVEWDARLASDMIAKQVQVLRQDKDTYANEITALKQAYAEDKITQSYQEFCQFWSDTLGWHPFLD